MTVTIFAILGGSRFVVVLNPTVDANFTVRVLILLVRTEWNPLKEMFIGRDFRERDDNLSENVVFVLDVDL